MNNSTALALGLIVIGFIILDQTYLGWDSHVFLGRKFLDLIDKMAVWR